ncbi:Serine/threonine-protein kinase, putative, partial [Candida maltosa Xu316]
ILPMFDNQYYRTPSYSPPPELSQPCQKPNPNEHLNGYMLNHELQFIKKIGAGTYGLIYLVENIYTKQQFAAKMVLKQPSNKQSNTKDTAMNKKLIQSQFYHYFLNHPIPTPQSLSLDYLRNQGHACPFLTEISLHLKVHQHPNIMTIHQVFNLDNFAMIILMDYFEQGDLFGNIIDQQIFSNHKYNKQLLMKNAMLQLIDAIEYCSQNNIYHCDLKPENIMVRYNPSYQRPSNNNNNDNIIDYNELHLVLIDFGLAMDSNLICCNACRGSSFYMAPERTTNFNTHKAIRQLVDMSQFETIEMDGTTVTQSNCKYLPTLSGDIWSLGVLFINITCSRNPWPIASFNDANRDSNDVFRNYMLNNNKNILAKILPISAQFNRLLDKIFKLNPNERIDLQTLYREVIRCDFFKDDHRQPSSNQQLYTPPETATYNSYASDIDEDDISDEEFYSDEEEEEDDEQQQVDNDDTNTTATSTTVGSVK